MKLEERIQKKESRRKNPEERIQKKEDRRQKAAVRRRGLFSFIIFFGRVIPFNNKNAENVTHDLIKSFLTCCISMKKNYRFIYYILLNK